MNPPKKIAAIVTEYRKNSHADVIVGKILEGFDQKGGKGPDLKVASMYVDQYPAGDMSRALAAKYNFPIYDSIAKALTLGGQTIAVDGVLNIGEHGKYPTNDKGQLLYPRRRFFEEVALTMERCKKVVPVFNDKHLAATWTDAKWMYDRARELFIPFMAGSSLPVTWRKPPITLPRDCVIEGAVAIGYGPFEGYGFHLLETLQCMVERRKGGETGVKQVQCLTGPAMWKSQDEGRWSRELLEAGIALMPAKATGNYREMCLRDKSAGVFLIDYRDGLAAAAVMLNGFAYEGFSGAFVFAAKVRGEPRPVVTHFYLENRAPFGHFGYQLKAIEHMIQTQHPAYPVERTLLTTGILDAVMTSKHENDRAIATPYLDVRYQARDWPFAPEPAPGPEK